MPIRCSSVKVSIGGRVEDVEWQLKAFTGSVTERGLLSWSAVHGLPVGERLLALAAVFLVALKIWFSIGTFPVADEAYYWMWGRHLAWSYFDHPPLQGWLQALSYFVLGRSTFALRWASFAAFLGTAWILLDIARRIGGDAWRLVFLKSLVVYLASPMFGIFGSVVFNDYLMVFFVIASGYLFMRYFADVEAAGAGHRGQLFGAAALLGLAALSKYNGALLGFAVVGTILIRPRLRVLLGRPELYAAAGLAIVLQVPVLIYGLATDFGSFRFQLSARFDETFNGLVWREMASATVGVLTMLSPFVMVPLVRFFFSWKLTPLEQPGRVLALLLFLLSSLPLLYVANFATVLPWWNIAAFAVALPFLGRHIDRFTLSLHVLFGALVTTLFVVSFTIVPISALVGGRPFYETEHAFGWSELGQLVVNARTEHGADFLATNRYQTASQLAFELDDPDVVALSSRRDAFDDWFDPASRAGQNAIVLIDGRDDTETYKRHFVRLTEIGSYTAAPHGYPVQTYSLWLGEEFLPELMEVAD